MFVVYFFIYFVGVNGQKVLSSIPLEFVN